MFTDAIVNPITFGIAAQYQIVPLTSSRNTKATSNTSWAQQVGTVKKNGQNRDLYHIVSQYIP